MKTSSNTKNNCKFLICLRKHLLTFESLFFLLKKNDWHFYLLLIVFYLDLIKKTTQIVNSYFYVCLTIYKQTGIVFKHDKYYMNLKKNKTFV